MNASKLLVVAKLDLNFKIKSKLGGRSRLKVRREHESMERDQQSGQVHSSVIVWQTFF